MKRTALCLLLILTATWVAIAQKKPSPITLSADAPEWIQMIESDNPNVFDIVQSYKAYYNERPFQKNTYTQYYKRWMHWARPYLQSDGTILVPTAAEQAANEAAILAQRQLATQGRSAGGSWTFAAPQRTVHTDGTTAVTWQTNIYSMDIAPSNANILYAGGEGGGLWKTTDKGLNWSLLTANVVHGAFGSVKIHPTDPNIVFACTGGKIIKTNDGGITWINAYTESNLWVNEMAISTSNPNIILAAADQGLLRSADGGSTWTKIHTQQTWAVKFKPGDPNTVFAARANGTSSSFLRSTNGGASFSSVGTGWWTPSAGLSVTGIHIAVCPSSPSKLYAYLCGSGGSLEGFVGVFVSNDNGSTWSNTNPQNLIGNTPVAYSIPAHTNLMDASGTVWFNQGFYDMAIVVNPANDQQLIAGGCSWFKSNDGGKTWSGLGGYVGDLPWSHPDIQSLSAVGSDLWITSDGGINYSSDWAATSQARMNGISGSDMWGFDAGWNDDYLVGGRYHNGNMAWSEDFPNGTAYRMGGAEAATGYVNPGPGKKSLFSDIGGYSLNGGLTEGVSSFGTSLFPNESYAYYANSEMVWHPECWNTVFMGHENILWKSTDGGTSYSALYTFPGTADNDVYDIEISRSNPQVMYCSVWDGTDDRIWRSQNGGTTWTAVTPLPLPNNNDRLKLAVAAEDANVLWVGITYGSNGKKIYKTINGGQTWQNLTTAALNGRRVSNIMAQYGTNGGIYLGTDSGVFYRNNTHADWQLYADGLPVSAETNRLKPFYRDGKIRNGCWSFGIWEAPLFEPSAVIAQPMASTLASNCTRDTVYFDDYSVVLHDGATWNWAFSPAPSYVSATNIRNPRVVFGQPGTYTATMTLNGQYTKSLQVQVANRCEPDSIPGMAVQLGGNSNAGYVGIPPLGITTNTFSVSAWVKPEGIQPDYSAIFMLDGDVAAGVNFLPGSNQIGYHWPGGQWWWNSGLTAPSGVWSHVVLTVAPNAISIYVNGVRSIHNITAEAVAFNSGSRFGNYKGWGDRHIKGQLEEATIWNKTLSQNEVRELMNLTLRPAAQPNLIAYYQFNEADGQGLDRVGIRHGSLSGSAKRIKSTCPVGPGTSFRSNVVTGRKRFSFDGTGMTLVFAPNTTYPNGEVVVTRLRIRPDTIPTNSDIIPTYWIVRNYGSNAQFSAPAEVWMKLPGGVPADLPDGAGTLFKRTPQGEGFTWQSMDQADQMPAGNNVSVGFTASTQVRSSGQYYIGLPAWYPSGKPADIAKENGLTSTSVEAKPNIPSVSVFPNPASTETAIQISVDTDDPCTIRVYDEQGRAIQIRQFVRSATLLPLSAGQYVYRVQNGHFMKIGKIVVQ